MTEEELKPFSIAAQEWPAIARALERAFPHRTWKSTKPGQQLTDYDPWKAMTHPMTGVSADAEYNRANIRIVLVNNINTLEDKPKDPICYTWQFANAADMKDCDTLVPVDKYRPKTVLTSMEF